jgi:hypothetical protein
MSVRTRRFTCKDRRTVHPGSPSNRTKGGAVWDLEAESTRLHELKLDEIPMDQKGWDRAVNVAYRKAAGGGVAQYALVRLSHFHPHIPTLHVLAPLSRFLPVTA